MKKFPTQFMGTKYFSAKAKCFRKKKTETMLRVLGILGNITGSSNVSANGAKAWLQRSCADAVLDAVVSSTGVFVEICCIECFLQPQRAVLFAFGDLVCFGEHSKSRSRCFFKLYSTELLKVPIQENCVRYF